MKKGYRQGFMFLTVTAICGFNLLSLPTLTMVSVWGVIFAAFFIWTNLLAIKYRWRWVNIIWLVLAFIGIALMLMQYQLTDYLRELASSFAFIASLFGAIRGFISEVNKAGKNNG